MAPNNKTDQPEKEVEAPKTKDYILTKGYVSRIEDGKRTKYAVGDVLALTEEQAKKVGMKSLRLKPDAPVKTEEDDKKPTGKK